MPYRQLLAVKTFRGWSELSRGLERKPGYLVDLLARRNDQPVVLVVDQFEELFTLCDNDQSRDAFVAHLLALVDTPHPANRVVLTMRTDFVDNVVRQPQLWPHFRAARIDVDTLDINELRSGHRTACRQSRSAFRRGHRRRPHLHDPGRTGWIASTPVHPAQALASAAAQSHHPRLYGQVGNPRQALERSAEEFFSHLLPEDQTRLKTILLRMVRLDEGREFTSSRIRLAEIFRNVGATDRVAWVLRRLIFEEHLVKLTGADAKPIRRILESETGLADQLAQFSDAQIEVAHEALVRNWPRLVRWLEDGWDDFRRRRRLTEAAEQWWVLERDARALLGGIQLEEALRYTDLNALETEYVAASKEQVEQEQRRWRNLAEEAERQARIATARQLAAESKDYQFFAPEPAAGLGSPASHVR